MSADAIAEPAELAAPATVSDAADVVSSESPSLAAAVDAGSPDRPLIAASSSSFSCVSARLDVLAHLLQRLHKVLLSPVGTDRLLSTIGYGLKLVASFLAALDRRRAGAAVPTRTIADVGTSKSPIASLPAGSVPTAGTIGQSPTGATVYIPPPGRFDVQIGKLNKIETLISRFRTFSRLWGLVGISMWALGHWKSAPVSSSSSSTGKSAEESIKSDKLIRTIVWAQIAACVGFQTLENGAFLAQQGILAWSGKTQGRAWVWSVRCWAAHVFLDLAKLGREAVLERRASRVCVEGAGQSEKTTTATTTTVTADAAKVEKDAAWYRAVATNAAFAPMTLHWSIPQGLLSDPSLSMLGFVAGAIGLSESWGKTA